MDEDTDSDGEHYENPVARADTDRVRYMPPNLMQDSILKVTSQQSDSRASVKKTAPKLPTMQLNDSTDNVKGDIDRLVLTPRDIGMS